MAKLRFNIQILFCNSALDSSYTVSCHIWTQNSPSHLVLPMGHLGNVWERRKSPFLHSCLGSGMWWTEEDTLNGTGGWRGAVLSPEKSKRGFFNSQLPPGRLTEMMSVSNFSSPAKCFECIASSFHVYSHCTTSFQMKQLHFDSVKFLCNTHEFQRAVEFKFCHEGLNMFWPTTAPSSKCEQNGVSDDSISPNLS